MEELDYWINWLFLFFDNYLDFFNVLNNVFVVVGLIDCFEVLINKVDVFLFYIEVLFIVGVNIFIEVQYVEVVGIIVMVDDINVSVFVVEVQIVEIVVFLSVFIIVQA